MRRPGIVIALAATAILWAARSANGLTIIASFAGEGDLLPGVGIAADSPAITTGGGTLSEIFRAAADEWERLIRDDFTITLDFGWYSTAPYSTTAFHQPISAGDEPGRETAGSIAFNSESANFYLDPNPSESSDFGDAIIRSIALGERELTFRHELAAESDEAIGRVDLFSTAIHEIGHALGLSVWSFYQEETRDGDIDVDLPGYEGTEIPVVGTHLALDGPAISAVSRPLGRRRMITQVDLAAVCQVSGFEKCAIEAGDYDYDGFLGVGDFVVWKESFGSTTDLDADGNGDGVIDAADYTLWRNRFGAYETIAFPATAPEPGTLAMATLGVIAIGNSLRRPRKSMHVSGSRA